MKRITVIPVFFLVLLVLSGCSGSTFALKGGPAVLANLANDLRNNGPLETSPGGFVHRNKDARLGALINDNRGVSKDAEIFVLGEGNIWVPYNGQAEVFTPGWRKIWDKGKNKWVWEKLSSRWLRVDGLEAIHFESPFMQSVTLRFRENGETKEIMFETAGRTENGNVYERINVLFIKLPLNQYRFNVYSYTGQLVFKSAEGRPYTRHLSINSDPTDYQIGNTRVGWKLNL